MSLQFIEGGAGTGKTTTVIARLGQLVAKSPLGAHQRVLALTKMHGSRRRVRDRLDLHDPRLEPRGTGPHSSAAVIVSVHHWE
jgi:superfamily I DNA/RNA helicase